VAVGWSQSTYQLHANLGPIPFNVYHLSNNANPACSGETCFKYIPNCSVTKTVRQCYQEIMNDYQTRGVTGVRFQFGMRGGEQHGPVLYGYVL